MNTNAKLFVVVVVGREARSGVKGNPVVASEGERFIATTEPDGWVEATSSRYDGKIPADAKTFTTYGDAETFAKRWKGHPWWCVPSGKYEIIEVAPRYRQVSDGYDVYVKRCLSDAR